MEQNNDLYNFKIHTVYSTIAYIFAYIFVYLSFNVVNAKVAQTYNIKSFLIHNKLFFATPDKSILWNFDSVITIFVSGILFLFILALVFSLLFRFVRHKEIFLKVFIFWIILQSISRALGSFIEGIVLRMQYSNLQFKLLEVNIGYRLLLLILFLVLLLFIATSTTRRLLLTTKLFTLVEDVKRHYFVLYQGFYPWFFGTVIIFFLHLPKLAIPEIVINLIMLILIFPSFFRHQDQDTFYNDSEILEPKLKVPWVLTSLIFIFIIAFRVSFNFGIPF